MALWLKIVVSVGKQQKFIEAGPIASWLWLTGLGYSREATTDGFIPRAVVSGLVPGLKAPAKFAARLVAVGLWQESESGYQIHDYLDWNPSKAEVEALRKADADRKRFKRNVRPESERNPDGIQTTALARARSGSPSHSGSEVVREESARETHDGGSRDHGLVDGSAQRQHGQHAWCSWPARDGLCVPAFLHRELVGKLNRPTAAAELLAWYPTVVARFVAVAVGDDALRFWRNEFAGWVGTVTQAPAPVSTKAARSAAAFDAADHRLGAVHDSRRTGTTAPGAEVARRGAARGGR